MMAVMTLPNETETDNFWKYPDKRQTALFDEIRLVFDLLRDDVNIINSRFSTLDGDLTLVQLRKFDEDLKILEYNDYFDNNILKLYATDIKKQKRKNRSSAFDVLLMAAFSKIYYIIFEKSKIVNADIFKNKYKEFSQTKYKKVIPKNLYENPLPSGVSPQDMIETETIFRAGQVGKTIKSQRILNEEFDNITETAVNIEIERAQNALMTKSKHGGYHGIIETIMSSMIGYAAMVALETTTAETYTFYNPLDDRTTTICAYLCGHSEYGKKYPVADAKLGWNVPPIFVDMRTLNPFPHHCRSWIKINY